MKRKLVGVRINAAEALCFKCGNRATQMAYYDIGDGFLHTEKFCDSCFSGKSKDADYLLSGQAFDKVIGGIREQNLPSKHDSDNLKSQEKL
jgi:hypothetical protein